MSQVQSVQPDATSYALHSPSPTKENRMALGHFTFVLIPNQNRINKRIILWTKSWLLKTEIYLPEITAIINVKFIVKVRYTILI